MGPQNSNGLIGQVIPSVSDEAIAEAVERVLRQSQAPMFLSALGLRLSGYFSHPIRDILGDRKLKSIIEEQLHDEVQLIGSTDKIEVKLRPDSEKIEPRRYDSTFWAAFAKPVSSGKLARALCPTAPYDFRDVGADEDVPSGWIAIPSASIPSAELPKKERDATIKASIAAWCGEHHLDPMMFSVSNIGRSEKREYTKGSRSSDGKAKSEGSKVALLVAFIDAIPEDRRKDYSLPMNLIYEFIR